MTIKPYIEAVEHCIDRTTRDFQKLAFNFHTESDLRSCLFGYLRRESRLRVRCCGGSVVHLIHAEFPVLWETGEVSGRYDLVVWKPQYVAQLTEDELNALWGAEHSGRASNIPLLVAVKVKHLYGGYGSIKHLSSYARVKKHGDMAKLLRGRSQYGYFLAFSDEDVKEHSDCQQYFEKMRVSFERLRREIGSRLRVLCVSRDNYDPVRLGFADH